MNAPHLLHLATACMLACTTALIANAQSDSTVLRNLFDEALERGHAYENLRSLCKDVGHRLSGSEGARRAVAWSEALMRTYGFDRVYTQPVMVPYWQRGAKEYCAIAGTDSLLDALALGGSVASGGIITAPVVEFRTLQALKDAPDGSMAGKIVFLNQAMNARMIDTFNAYGGCAGARVWGPSEAARKGAIAFVMRSVGLRADDYPHTGVLVYATDTDSIPALALSTNAAHHLSRQLARKPGMELSVATYCRTLPDAPSHNVVCEIRGSQFPNKVFTIGGHLDSWDVGEGAHDDGAGVIQALEALRLLKVLGIKPRHTIRCVFFMNEENGSRGAKVYKEACREAGEQHLAAMESDRGGFTPRGFHVDATPQHVEHLQGFLGLFEPYLIHIIKPGYGGVDINPLKEFGTPLIGVVPDSQRYFDVHHTAHDTFETVNRRELELGAAAMAALVYLIDKYGWPERVRG